LWPQLMLFLQLLWVLTFSTAKFAEFFVFLPSVHFAKRAGPHKCAYAREGLWCQIHKLFKQQRRSTNSAVTFFPQLQSLWSCLWTVHFSTMVWRWMCVCQMEGSDVV
jgi:hypothetical protein